VSEPPPTGAPIDLLVIGGGITGCAVARDAAARGLTVTLVEQRDLAAGTSGRSTKLLHGGLRYLEHGNLRLVREALREREITARLAPALSRPLRLVLPVRPGVFPGRWVARLGVGLYDLLAGSRSSLPKGAGVSEAEVAAAAPALAGRFDGGVAFHDRQTDDAALTVAIARDARSRGAVVRLGVAVTRIARRSDGTHRTSLREEDGRLSEVVSRCVVNACGAWSDRVRALAGKTTGLLRVTRGAHLVVDGLELRCGLLLPGARPGHRLFALPWRGCTLFGTTDVEDDGDPGRDLPDPADIRLLFDELRRLFPSAGLERRHVISAFTGTRPLLRQAGDTLAMSREHRVLDEEGLVTIAGGKLTTWRPMAVETVDAVVRHFGRAVGSPESLMHQPLPGGSDECMTVGAAITEGFARHADDVVFRRLPIGHDPAHVARSLPSILETMTVHLGWDAARRDEESSRVLDPLARLARRIDEAIGSVGG